MSLKLLWLLLFLFFAGVYIMLPAQFSFVLFIFLALISAFGIVLFYAIYKALRNL